MAFFSPLKGFMGQADVDSVVRHMTLANGYVWSIPMVLDVSGEELASIGVREGNSVLLTHQEQPLAVLEVEEIFFLRQGTHGPARLRHHRRSPSGGIAHLILPGPFRSRSNYLGESSSGKSALRQVLAYPQATAGKICRTGMEQGCGPPDP